MIFESYSQVNRETRPSDGPVFFEHGPVMTYSYVARLLNKLSVLIGSLPTGVALFFFYERKL